MARRPLLHCLLVLALSTGPAIADEYVKLEGDVEVTSSLRVSLSDVDDIADVYVINDKTVGPGLSPVVRAIWNNGDGRAHGDLSSSLIPGNNYVVFTSFNRRYAGFSFHSSGGKWSHDIRITLDGETVYRDTAFEDYNLPKLKHVAYFKVLVSPEGKITEFEAPMNKAEYQTLKRFVWEGLEPQLQATGMATVNAAKLLRQFAEDDPALREYVEQFSEVMNSPR